MAPFVTPPFFDPEVDSNYHYVPTGWVCIVFIVLFGISTFVHTVEALYFKLWWLLPTAVLAGLGEILGWSARYWSSLNDGILDTPFLMQISCTIIAPTPLLAAYFIIVGRLIVVLGPQYSRLKPSLYNKIFLTIDIIALVIQAAGGGIASGSNSNLGANIMLAGIAFQLASLIVFSTLSVEYFYRLITNKPIRDVGTSSVTSPGSSSISFSKGVSGLPRPVVPLIAGIAFSILCLFIRAVYRLIELSDGWNGRVISTQVYFNVLDGMMVVLAIVTLNVLHPGPVLRPKAF